MPKLVMFYRVNLQEGVTVEERPSGFYRDDPALNRTIFRDYRKAKVEFSKSVRSEIQRLRQLKKQVGPLTNRRQLKEHAFSAYQPD